MSCACTCGNDNVDDGAGLFSEAGLLVAAAQFGGVGEQVGGGRQPRPAFRCVGLVRVEALHASPSRTHPCVLLVPVILSVKSLLQVSSVDKIKL